MSQQQCSPCILYRYFNPQEERHQPTDQCRRCGTVLSHCCVTCLLASQHSPSSRPRSPGSATWHHTIQENVRTSQKNSSSSPCSSSVDVQHTEPHPVLDHSEEVMETDDFLDTCYSDEKMLSETASRKTNLQKTITPKKSTWKKTDCSRMEADIEGTQANRTFDVIKSELVELGCDNPSDHASSEQTAGCQPAYIGPETRRRQKPSSLDHGESLTAETDVTPDTQKHVTCQIDHSFDAGSLLPHESGYNLTSPLPQENDTDLTSPPSEREGIVSTPPLLLEVDCEPVSPLPQQTSPNSAEPPSLEGEPVPNLPANTQSPESGARPQKTKTVIPEFEPIAHSSGTSTLEGSITETDSSVTLSLVIDTGNIQTPMRVRQTVYATRSRGPLPLEKKDPSKETLQEKQMISNRKSARCSSKPLPKRHTVRYPKNLKSKRRCITNESLTRVKKSNNNCKRRKTRTDGEWVPSDSERDKLLQNIPDSDEEITDSEEFKPYKKKRTQAEKVYTIEEFMAGKLRIPSCSLYGKQLAKTRDSSYYSHYMCPKCCKVFVSVSEYRHHKSTHLSEETSDQPAPQGPDPESLKILTEIKERYLFCCPHCNRFFLSRLQFNKHVMSHNYSVDTEGVYTCHLCKGTFKTSECILQHFKTLKGRMEMCEACGFRCTFHCQMKEHSKIDCIKKDTAKACSICGESFHSLSKREINKHLKTHNIVKACEFCGQSLDNLSKREVKKHLKTHKEVTARKEGRLCTICGKVMSHHSFRDHLRTHSTETPFSCSVCQKTFKRKHDMINHKLIHGKKSQQCDQCGAKFSNLHHLQRHKSCKHEGKRFRFHCKECDKTLSTRAQLRIHLLDVHNKMNKQTKKYPCNFCFKAFPSKDKLERHERVHKDEKPFQCEFCKAKFRQKSYLNMHTRIHTGEKRYHCEDCSQGFAFRSSYTSHRKSRHSDKRYPCVQCKKEFLDKSDLASHRHKWHDGATQ